MKTLKLSNKKRLLIILFYLLFGFESSSQEPVDIWNTEIKVKTEEDKNSNLKKKIIPQNTIYEMQSKKKLT